MTKLVFQDPEGFIKYLMEKDIHRYGIVTHCKETLERGLMSLYTESFLLSSIDDKTNEILKCSVTYFQKTILYTKQDFQKTILYTKQDLKKDAKTSKEKALHELQEKIKKWTGDFKLTLLHCQFEE